MKSYDITLESRIRMAGQVVDMSNYMDWPYHRTLAIRRVYEQHHPQNEVLPRLHEYISLAFEKYMGVTK
jgi:hypothetical protein